MTYITNKDYLTEVQRGNVSGATMVHKFGRNDVVPNGSWAHVSLTPFSIANFRQSAATMRIKAGGNAADTAAGNGAREVTIQGIDSSFAETSEAVATNGGSASSATTASFWRVHRAWVSAVGVYGAANTGDVVIEDSGGSADMITIAADEGQTQYAGWTVPTGKTAYLLGVHATVDSRKYVNMRCFTRDDIDDVSAPMPSKRLKLFWDGIAGSFDYRPYGPELSISEKSDIWFEAYGDGAACEVAVDFELLVIDN
jgi:hypothetical protein